jgi:hypothetical protein
MKVNMLALLRPSATKVADAVFLACASDVSEMGFFERRPAREFLTFVSRKIAGAVEPNVRFLCTENGYVIHAFYTAPGVVGVMIGTGEYPKRVAFALVAQLIQDFVKVREGRGPGSCFTALHVQCTRV